MANPIHSSVSVRRLFLRALLQMVRPSDLPHNPHLSNPTHLATLSCPSGGRLTQHGDAGLGCPHRHGEDGAGVFALVRQHHVIDADGQLIGS